jgi:hypothetical protein
MGQDREQVELGFGLEKTGSGPQGTRSRTLTAKNAEYAEEKNFLANSAIFAVKSLLGNPYSNQI